MEAMAKEIKDSGSIGVDTVSGATVTSDAVLEAAAAALTSAGLNPDDYKTAVSAATAAGDVTEEADVGSRSSFWKARRWAGATPCVRPAA